MIMLHTVVNQRLTHFNSAQSLKNVSIFGVSIFGMSLLTVFFSKFFDPKIDILPFREHRGTDVFWRIFLTD